MGLSEQQKERITNKLYEAQQKLHDAIKEMEDLYQDVENMSVYDSLCEANNKLQEILNRPQVL